MRYLGDMQEAQIIQMDSQGRVVLPKSLRSEAHRYFNCLTEEDGTVHLMPIVGVITNKQAYFWSKRWQAGETEASAAIQKKNYKTVKAKELNAYLDRL